MLNWGNLVPIYVHLRAQLPVHLQVQQIQSYLHYVQRKSKLNTEHDMKLTNNWRDIAVYIGSNALVNRLMIGDHGANSWFCHKRCSNNLYSRFTKKQKEECKGKIDIDHVKEAAWDNVIASMNETLPSVAKDTAQKMKFSNKDFLSKWDQIRRKLRIWSHLVKKSLMENFIFRAVGRFWFDLRELENIYLDLSHISWFLRVPDFHRKPYYTIW